MCGEVHEHESRLQLEDEDEVAKAAIGVHSKDKWRVEGTRDTGTGQAQGASWIPA